MATSRMRRFLSLAAIAAVAFAIQPVAAQQASLPYSAVTADCATLPAPSVTKPFPDYVDTTNTSCKKAGASALATGAATAAKQDTGNSALSTITTQTSHLPAALGQGTQAQSLPVVLPSDPDVRPTSGNITIVDTGSTTTAGFNSINLVTGSPTAASVKNFAINGMSTATCTITGTWTGALTFEGSGDSATYTANTLRQRGGSFRSATTTGNGVFQGDVSGMTNFRVRATSAMTGTAVVQCAFTASSGPVQVQNPISIYDNSSNSQATIKPASTAPGATDPALVIGIGPNGNNVGGYEAFVSDTPTIQNAQYVSGNCMGGFQSVTAARATGGAGILDTVTLASKGGGTTALTLYIFNSNPSSSTCTDKSTFTLNAADIPKLIYPPTAITPTVPIGTTVSLAAITNMAASYVTSGDAKLYFGIVSGGTWTPASTTDLIVNLGGPED